MFRLISGSMKMSHIAFYTTTTLTKNNFTFDKNYFALPVVSLSTTVSFFVIRIGIIAYLCNSYFINSPPAKP